MILGFGVKKNCVFGSGLMRVNGIEICTAEYASLSQRNTMKVTNIVVGDTKEAEMKNMKRQKKRQKERHSIWMICKVLEKWEKFYNKGIG